MRSLKLPVLALLAFSVAATGRAVERNALDGLVTDGPRGLGQVSVYAYEVARATLVEATTGTEGRFSFPDLPSGLYKIVAFKHGYSPAIAVLSRAADQGLQFVELELATEEARRDTEDDYWSLREQIPTDVLRDIELGRLADATVAIPLRGNFAGTLLAQAGVSGGEGQGQMSGASIDLAGRVGTLDIGVDGSFQQLEPARSPSLTAGPGAEFLTNLGLEMSSVGAGTMRFDTEHSRFEQGFDTTLDPIDLTHHRVTWSRDASAGRSGVVAELVERGDLYVASGLAELSLPFAARTWRLEGSWERELADWGGLRTAVRYIEHELGTATEPVARRLEIEGSAGWNPSSAVLVEYGLFTRLADGSMSLAPRGAVVLQLGDQWQASATASARVVDDPGSSGFNAILASQPRATASSCAGLAEATCLRLELKHDEHFRVAATTREIADVVRLTFDDDLVEGLLLLPGDRIPEVEIGASRQLAPGVTATFESVVGAGGGGRLVGSVGPSNRVRYIMTSVETRFDQSETGVFIAFQSLEQQLAGSRSDGNPNEALERLQVRVSQNLDGLLDLAANWAVHVGMELSRGRLPFTPVEVDPAALRRRVTGGLAVRF